jgi:mannose-6-phosphate isomerase-like protein (cupin superfamily)
LHNLAADIRLVLTGKGAQRGHRVLWHRVDRRRLAVPIRGMASRVRVQGAGSGRRGGAAQQRSRDCWHPLCVSGASSLLTQVDQYGTVDRVVARTCAAVFKLAGGSSPEQWRRSRIWRTSMTVHNDQVLQSRRLAGPYDYLAPDGSEIRLLVERSAGGLSHCTLPPSGVSKAVAHRSVEELWYTVSGSGEVWGKIGRLEEILSVESGSSFVIPPGVTFQFRNSGDVPLCVIIVTMPRWPGPDEAMPGEGPWTATEHSAP